MEAGPVKPEQGSLRGGGPQGAVVVVEQSVDGLVRQSLGLPKGLDLASLETVEARFRGSDPDGTILTLCQALDLVMRKSRNVDARVVLESGPVKADEPRFGANPEESVLRFNQGRCRVLEEPIFTAPSVMGMDRQQPGWIQCEGCDRHP